MIERFKPMRNKITHPVVTLFYIGDYLLFLVLSSYPSESFYDKKFLFPLGSVGYQESPPKVCSNIYVRVCDDDCCRSKVHAQC